MSASGVLYDNIIQLFKTGCNTRNYNLVRQTISLFDENNLDLNEHIVDLLYPCQQLIEQNQIDLLIFIINWLFSKNYINLDARIVSDLYTDICITGNVNFLQRVWTECNLVNNTYLMPHECFNRVFYECDPPINILQTMIAHFEESNEYNDEIEDYSEWLLCSTLINNAENCTRYLLNMYPDNVSVKIVLSSIMSGNPDLFDIVYNRYRSNHENINYNKMFSIAAGYGGLNILRHLLILFPINDSTATIMCSYAVSRGNVDVLQFVCEVFMNINYTTVLQKTQRFINIRNNNLLQYNSYYQEYERQYWEVSINWETEFQNCQQILAEFTA
jgi:hypothetical protein